MLEDFYGIFSGNNKAKKVKVYSCVRLPPVGSLQRHHYFNDLILTELLTITGCVLTANLLA